MKKRSSAARFIGYNFINLPTTIGQTADEYYLEYMYSASGSQLQTKEYEDQKLIKTTDYCGQFVYEACPELVEGTNNFRTL